MGSGRFDSTAYNAFASSTVGKATHEIYTSGSLDKDLNPHGVKIRESRDSEDNPRSTPIIVALDVTGSMGMLADVIAREGLGKLFSGILERKPVSDPHLMFMGIGDVEYDSAPLQVSQFEADTRIIDQLTKLYLEHGGGGNSYESYHMPWYFAWKHTVHDSFEKRGKRGYLFTVGDEEVPTPLSKEAIKRFIGDDAQHGYSAAELLDYARDTYDCFHVIVEEGNHARYALSRVKSAWESLMPQRVISLPDHKKLAEVIVSAIEVAEGVSAHDSAARWGGAATGIVQQAVASLAPARQPKMLPGAHP